MDDEARAQPHPVRSVDLDEAARAAFGTLTGEPHWDRLMCEMNPHMADCGPDTAEYTLEACIDDGDLEDCDIEATDPRAVEALRRWCGRRMPVVADRIAAAVVVDADGMVRAHRILSGADPAALRPSLGAFWTFALDDWPDPYAPWGGDRDEPAIVVEAMIPVEAIAWRETVLSNACWWSGDCESELRLRRGHPVRVLSASMLADDARVALADLAWTT